MTMQWTTMVGDRDLAPAGRKVRTRQESHSAESQEGFLGVLGDEKAEQLLSEPAS